MYSDNFTKSLTALWKHECGYDKKTKKCRVDIDGGLNDIPEDNGGITKYGISLRFYKLINKKAGKDSIRNLSKEEAIDIYWRYFYSNLNYQKINDYKLSKKLFLTAVNMGKNRPNKWLQEICNDLGSKLKVDGVIGNKSLEEINKWTDIHYEKIKDSFIKKQSEEYKRIVNKNPSQKVFEKGWQKRAKEW